MGSGYSGRVLSAIAGITLCSLHATALAADICAPSEATDPQPLHINGSTPYVYKTVGEDELRLHVFRSAALKPDEKSPAVVFFYGGGFLIGDIRRFQTQATHLALQGLVTVLADYRVNCRHGTTITESVIDGKSAMRWVRGHADELGIDPDRIAIVGSSAGGLMATAAALITDFNDPSDDEQIDPRPDALVLYNPGLNTKSPSTVEFMKTYWDIDVADRAAALSPSDHLDDTLPPTIIFQGTADEFTPHPIAEGFCERAKALGARCDVVLYPDAPHGFTEIWLGLEDPVKFPKTEFWAEDTSERTDAFLTDLGWLPAR